MMAARSLNLPKVLWVVAVAAAGACRQSADLPVSPAAAELGTNAVATNQSPPLQEAPAKLHGVELTDVTERTGITFVQDDGSSGDRYLPEAVTGGMALFDFDGDGLIDIYFLSAVRLPLGSAEASQANALYRNEGDWKFRDVTREAGVGHEGFALGVAVADYDNDGHPDVFVNNYGPDVLYRNNGDGTFTEWTKLAGVPGGDDVGAGTCFVDIDADGHLDLFVANYVEFQCHLNPRRTIDGFPSYPGPLDFEPARGLLFHSQGDGTFADISNTSGIASVAGTGMGVIAADYDGDGDSDIFVANDEMGNFLFENDGKGRFQEVGIFHGLAYDRSGKPQGNMGVDCADYDGDGRLDFFSTTFSNEPPALYHNRGHFFEEVAAASGASDGTLAHANWGTAFVDFDNDGLADLLVANGDFDEHVHHWKPGTALRTKNAVLKNMGRGKFLNISDQCGDGLAAIYSSRGTGTDDLDNDGRVDVVVLNWRERPTVVRNVSPANDHWLQVQLHGRVANRDGVGAQVRLTFGRQTQLAEVHSGRGYQSHHGTRLHFGLGESDRADRIEIRWLGGQTEILENIPANQCLHVVEGRCHAGLPGAAAD